MRNPPAFPNSGTDYILHAEGMSLRDWFAGQALAGLAVSRPTWLSLERAQRAYDDADAMLAARAKP